VGLILAGFSYQIVIKVPFLGFVTAASIPSLIFAHAS
jgi:hypothetical protein